MDFSRLFSEVCSKRWRTLSSILETAFQKAPPQKSRIGWAEGQQNPATFPIDEISFRLKDGTTCRLKDAELNVALKMAPAQGIPEVLCKLREMQNYWHSPPNDSWDIIVLNGSQDSLWRIFEAFVDSGDPVMVQTPAYFGVTGAIQSLSPELIEIEQDSDGIIPEKVEKIFEERIRKKKPLPKLLYVNPIGANPTGTVLTNERKQRVYELAQKYNFLIIEDDPYLFLHFLDEQPSSFLSMDTDGRVIRLDSFSKTISAGLRFGFVTAHKNLIDKLVIHVENTVMHASNLPQMIVYKLFESWSFEKFDQHFKEFQKFYRKKRDVMMDAVEKHLTGCYHNLQKFESLDVVYATFEGLAEWSVPKGGMFVWIRVTAIEDTLDLAMNKLVPYGIFVIPGKAFNFNGTQPDQHLRLCYSFATAEEVERGLSMIAKIIREEIKSKNIRSD